MNSRDPRADGPARRPRRPRRMRSAVATVVVGVFVLASACSNGSSSGDASNTSTPRELSGVIREPIPDVSAVTLSQADAAATPFRFVADEGTLLLVYFGYTACPDICPTTLADLKAALKQVGPKADDVSLAMATIDPRRDTADVITGYVRSFFPTATALRTEDHAALTAVTDAFGASYTAEYPNTGEPRVTHSAYLYVVDDQGHLVLQWPFGTTPNDIALDLEQLLA